MPHSPTEDDERTIKRCYRNLKKDQFNSNNLLSLPLNISNIKKPLNQLFYQHLNNDEDQKRNFDPNQDHKDFLTPSEPQKSLQLIDLTTKFEQNRNQNHENLQKCCTRLFTFMESTQKEKNIEENKQNQCNQNFMNVKENLKNSLKPNNSDLPLRILPKTQKSTKFLKKIDYRLKNNQKLDKLPKNDNQKDLLTYIEGSRKKRQQLLIQLKQLDLDDLESFGVENVRYLTPQEGTSKKHLTKVKVQTSRNSLQGGKSNKNFFRKHSLADQQKSPRVVMKENLRQRHFSELHLKQPIAIPSQKDQFHSFKTSRKNSVDSSKKQYLVKRLNGSSSKKFILLTKEQEIKETKNMCRKSTEKLNINNSKEKILRKSVSRKEKHGIQSLQENEKDKTIEKLMKRKKQLQNQLLTLNDDIFLFNRKKKKTSKGIK